MNFEQAKQKALERVRSKGLDQQLMAAFLETKHYAAWCTNQQNNEWNIGLENIKPVEVEKTPANRDALIDAVAATVDGIPFKLIGSHKISSMPDGDVFTTQTVWLHIRDTCVLEVNYSVRTLDAVLPNHYSMFSVDEYHESEELEKLLGRISTLIEDKQRRQKAKFEQQQAERYKGKFSFGDD
ncbi:hypothetical protein ACGYU5_15350 [Burkholderia pseudomallei]